MIEMIYPAGWGKKSQPMTRDDFEGLKRRIMQATEQSGISAGTLKVAHFPQQAPFVEKAVRELIEAGRLEQVMAGGLKHSYPPATYRPRGWRGE